MKQFATTQPWHWRTVRFANGDKSTVYTADGMRRLIANHRDGLHRNQITSIKSGEAKTMVVLLDCGHGPSKHSDFTTGYGISSDGKKHCYECCATRERDAMIKTGKATLYLTDKGVTDWPGKLQFSVVRKNTGSHNIARVRYDVWFIGPDKHIWHGVTYGDFTQICHCNRTKEKA